MSKPLELTVYPKDPTYEPSDSFTVYLLEDGKKECAGTACALPSKKRLTDAELAAEYHAMDSRCRHEQWIETVRGDDHYEDWERGMQSRMYEQLSTLHRFATMDHYDEATR